MKRDFKVGFVAAVVVVVLVSAVVAQKNGNNDNSDQEIVGTVSCPVCVPKGALKLDLVCARSCLDKNQNARGGNAANASSGSGGSASANSNPDTVPSNGATPNAAQGPDTDNDKPANPLKNADNGINLVIIEDGDYHSFVVDNPEKIKGHLAHRVSVTGYWINKKFHIVSVRTL